MGSLQIKGYSREFINIKPNNIFLIYQLMRYAHATRTVISYQLSVISYQLSVISYQRTAISATPTLLEVLSTKGQRLTADN
ncbi:MAG: hypothetical protein F6K26_17075 [Moorea sp. SIO2I5]|nr:hypothetical protein [Moorena sp. SIO2I5]